MDTTTMDTTAMIPAAGSKKRRKLSVSVVQGPEWRKKRKKLNLFKCLLDLVAADSAACSILAASSTREGQKAFTDYLKDRILPDLQKDPDFVLLLPRPESDIYSSFLQACTNADHLPLPLKGIPQALQTARKDRRSARSSLVRALKFNGSGQAERVLRMEKTEVLYAARLENPYPPYKHWVYDNPQIAAKWKKKLHHDPQPDGRLQRLPMLHLDPSELTLDILPHQSCVIRTPPPERRLVGIVLRDFCPVDDLLDALHNTIQTAVGVRKSSRLEDPGKLVQIGYSAGARSRPQFHWVRNLLPGNMEPEAITDLDKESSSAFALLWNLCKIILPEEVMGDFDAFMSKHDMVRMGAPEDAAAHAAGAGPELGSYRVQVGDVDFVFRSVEMAPPCGVFAQNYSRATHLEHQPHRWAISWTIRRSHGPGHGGDFFFSRYGVRVQGAENTLVIWDPSEEHGTSLQDFSPYEEYPCFIQTGLAIVTSNRLPGVWAKYKAGVLNYAEACDAMKLDDADEL